LLSILNLFEFFFIENYCGLNLSPISILLDPDLMLFFWFLYSKKPPAPWTVFLIAATYGLISIYL